MIGLINDGWMYKVMFALLDTPLMYGAVYLLRKKFRLKEGQEIV
jgi:uncharacterized PurR-regulated membrane protein YhhQ (DUF165 family)